MAETQEAGGAMPPPRGRGSRSRPVLLVAILFILAGLLILLGFRNAGPLREAAPFHPYQGSLKIGLDRDSSTPETDGRTVLDGLDLDGIAAFRRERVRRGNPLGLFPPDYDPRRPPHRGVYGAITPGLKWLGPTPYYLANPYLLIVFTCANHVTPLDLFCPLDEVEYRPGRIEERRSGLIARCWLGHLYASSDYPGRVWLVGVNAWDAGFRFLHVDPARSINLRPESDPRHVLNAAVSRRYFYHRGRSGWNNLSPSDRRFWIGLKERRSLTRIVTKLWHRPPASVDQAADLEYWLTVDPRFEEPPGKEPVVDSAPIAR